jgi:hypothetical protein
MLHSGSLNGRSSGYVFRLVVTAGAHPDALTQIIWTPCAVIEL